MLTPKRNFFATKFWNWYIHHIIHNDFQGIEVKSTFQPQEKESVLLIANHFSWWDGFFIYQLNQSLWKKQFNVMMLEDQLQKHQFLRYAGAFSIDRSNMRKAISSINYAAKLLQNPQSLVLMFPQGQIESQFVQSPTFKGGVLRIAKKVTNPFQIVFCVNKVDYLSERKPKVYSYIRKYEGDLSMDKLEQAYFDFYEQCNHKQGTLIS